MKFTVQKEVFSQLKNVCFGVVVARGVNNQDKSLIISELLSQNAQLVRENFQDVQVKQHEQIIPYRNAFTQLGFNPNKFACSIEALISRIIKGSQLPSINNIVDLANAISLKYLLPMGAHDMDNFKADITIRFSDAEDTFVPFGLNEPEQVGAGELVYVSGQQVKTRKWIWRQSEDGKITPTSTNIFFPIDGFKDTNYPAVISARDELADVLKKLFNCEVMTGFVDENNLSMEL